MGFNTDIISATTISGGTIYGDGSNLTGVIGSSYKVYTALLTQTGTTAPVATVLENTIGDIVWSYDSVGVYLVTSIGNFTENKTIIFMNGNNSIAYGIYPSINSIGNDITIETASISPLVYSDGILYNTPIEIRVYN
jgi:hypothetical protein